MNEKEYEEMMHSVMNQMNQIGREVTASDSMILALKIGKTVYFDDTFKHADLKQIMGAFTNFFASYVNSRLDFQIKTKVEKEQYTEMFIHRMKLLFLITEVTAKEILDKHNINSNKKCDHMGTLEDYVLNEGYWLCTKCKEKIKKHVR